MEISAKETNNESQLKVRKMPKSIPFILSCILLERFSTAGTFAILFLYFNRKLGFDHGISTAVYHMHELLAFIFPIIGAYIADSYLGLFRTITIMAFVYFIGATTIAIGSIESLNLPRAIFTLIGLFIAIAANGSLRSNLTTFGGNQFKLPEDSLQFKTFFSIQLIFFKSGSFLGRFFNPIAKEKVKCFGGDDCYPLAFGLPAIAMLLGSITMLCGRKAFFHVAHGENMLLKVCKCIMNAISNKISRNKFAEKKHWLEGATEKHGDELVFASKKVIGIICILFPTAVYWSAYLQQSSRWIFQATRMNGNLGWYIIAPDQMIAFNPIFAIILLPFCDYVLYPIFARIGLTSLLHKIAIGGFIGSTTMVISGFVEIQIEKNFISMLWLMPQYAVLALSENMVYISTLNFAYTEAPANMKSVMTAFVFLTIGSGNLIIIAISATKAFNSQVVEYFFFAGFTALAMIIFVILSRRYEKLNAKSTNCQ